MNELSFSDNVTSEDEYFIKFKFLEIWLVIIFIYYAVILLFVLYSILFFIVVYFLDSVPIPLSLTS